jgi:biopolymer transport protein ExbB
MMKHVVCAVLVLGSLALGSLPVKAAEPLPENAPRAVADEDSPAPVKKEPMSGLWWIVRSSGLIGLFILCLSIYFVALVVQLFLKMKLDLAVPPQLVARCEELIHARDLQGAYAAAQQDESFLGRVLSAGIAELSNGLMDAREAMDRAGDAETVHMEKQISMLAVLGTLGPMIGLIGTLKGMITSFKVIAISGVTLDASQVAGGISEALILTFEGVFLSVPAIYFYALFRNRVAVISSNGMLMADELLRHFHRATRTKGVTRPAASATAEPAVPPLPPGTTLRG